MIMRIILKDLLHNFTIVQSNSLRIVWKWVRRVIENQKISYFLAWIGCIFGHVDLAFAWVNSDITYTRYLLWACFEVVFGNIQFWLLQVINSLFGLHRLCPWPIFVQNFCWAVLNMLFYYVSWLWCVNAILNKDIHDKKKNKKKIFLLEGLN